MEETILVQIEKLSASIKALEAQRKLLGDEVVDTSLKALGAQLDIFLFFPKSCNCLNFVRFII